MDISVYTSAEEILDYFGKCPVCGYPASAWRYTQRHADGAVASLVVAHCGLPCGWSGPVEPTSMTRVARHRVRRD